MQTKTAYKPYLDNIETSVQSDTLPVYNYNYQRGYRTARLRGKARKLSGQLYNQAKIDKLKGKDVPEEVMNFCSKISKCSSMAIYRKPNDSNYLTYGGTISCKCKCCPVCNAERSRNLRKKWFNYVTKNEFVDIHTGEVYSRSDFDFMHLTLTLPHSSNGFEGEKFYLKKLKSAFKDLRRCEFWKQMIWGGEYSTEITNNIDTGSPHIHIHAMLMVLKTEKSRNKIYPELLYHWNRLTVDRTKDIKLAEVSGDRMDGIAKTLKFMDDQEHKHLLLNNIDGRGATMVGLESIYYLNRNNKKCYINEHSSDKVFMKGIMECFKYHFEPMVLEFNEDDNNIEFFFNIFSKIKNERMYDRFGNLRLVKELSIHSKTVMEEIKETIDEFAGEVKHPITGEVLNTEQYTYVAIDPKDVTYNVDRQTMCSNKYKPVMTKYNSLKDSMLWLVNVTFKNKRDDIPIDENLYEDCIDVIYHNNN